MPVRIYRFSAANTVTAVGVANTTIVARGRIKQAVVNQNGIGGAGEGRISVEAALNNNANGNSETATGAPSEFLITRSSLQFGNATNANVAFSVPLDIPVIPGNTVCLNFLQTGTAPARQMSMVDLHVME